MEKQKGKYSTKKEERVLEADITKLRTQKGSKEEWNAEEDMKSENENMSEAEAQAEVLEMQKNADNLATAAPCRSHSTPCKRGRSSDSESSRGASKQSRCSSEATLHLDTCDTIKLL